MQFGTDINASDLGNRSHGGIKCAGNGGNIHWRKHTLLDVWRRVSVSS